MLGLLRFTRWQFISSAMPFMETETSITAVHKCQPATGSCLEPDESSLNLFLSRSILILFSHLYLGLPTDLTSSGSPTKILYEFQIYFLFSLCTAHLILLVLIKFQLYWIIFLTMITWYIHNGDWKIRVVVSERPCLPLTPITSTFFGFKA
jgi:hypothetical protein